MKDMQPGLVLEFLTWGVSESSGRVYWAKCLFRDSSGPRDPGGGVGQHVLLLPIGHIFSHFSNVHPAGGGGVCKNVTGGGVKKFPGFMNPCRGV